MKMQFFKDVQAHNLDQYDTLYYLQYTVYDQGEAVPNDEIQYKYCTILPRVTPVTPDYARRALTNKGVDINALIYYFIFLYIAIYM